MVMELSSLEGQGVQMKTPELPRFFADGPDGCFYTDDIGLARRILDVYDESEDWTITDLHNPEGPYDE